VATGTFAPSFRNAWHASVFSKATWTAGAGLGHGGLSQHHGKRTSAVRMADSILSSVLLLFVKISLARDLGAIAFVFFIEVGRGTQRRKTNTKTQLPHYPLPNTPSPQLPYLRTPSHHTPHTSKLKFKPITTHTTRPYFPHITITTPLSNTYQTPPDSKHNNLYTNLNDVYQPLPWGAGEFGTPHASFGRLIRSVGGQTISTRSRSSPGTTGDTSGRQTSVQQRSIKFRGS